MATERSWWMTIIDTVLLLYSSIVTSGLPIIFWVKPRWSIEQMPNQQGRVVLITGANSGVGFESARALYEAGAKVYLACRSEKKAREAIEYILENPQPAAQGSRGELVFLQLDLADLKSVIKAADEFLSKEDRLDVLMANAGIMATAEGQYTKQGYTLQTGTNVLGHQALISRLLPVVLSTSRSTPTDPARIIVLSSAGHLGAPRHGFDYSALIADPEVLAKIQQGDDSYEPRKGKHELSRTAEYGQAKWGDLVLSKYLEGVYGPNGDAALEGRRVGEGELFNFSVHPGTIATNLANHIGAFQFLLKYVAWIFMFLVHMPDVGASNQLWAATMPVAEARKLSGSYIVPFQRIGRPRPDALKRANQVRLWDWCEEQVKKHV